MENTLDLFIKYYEGTWENITQARKYSSRFSKIVLTHKLIDINSESAFYIKQSYKHKEHAPYKQAIVVPKLISENSLELINYRVNDLDVFSKLLVTHTNFQFSGVVQKDNVIVIKGRKVKISGRFVLSEYNYTVQDRGEDDKGNKVFGSDFGPFKFEKII